MKFTSTDTQCNREKEGRGRVVSMRLQKQQENGCSSVSLFLWLVTGLLAPYLVRVLYLDQ